MLEIGILSKLIAEVSIVDSLLRFLLWLCWSHLHVLVHELLLEAVILRLSTFFEFHLIDRLFVLSHALAELQRLLRRLRVLVRNTVEEVTDAEIKQGVTLVGDELSFSEGLCPETDRGVAVIDQGDELPEGRVKCVGVLGLSLVRVVLISLRFLGDYLLVSFASLLFLLKNSVNILEVFFFVIIAATLCLLLLALCSVDRDNGLFLVSKLRVELENFKSDILTHLEELADDQKRRCCEIALIDKTHLKHALEEG